MSSRKMNKRIFDDKTEEWLSGWLSGGAEVDAPTDDIISSLSKYVPKEEITLYRAEVTYKLNGDEKEIIHTGYTSWTYNKNMAWCFVNGDDCCLIEAVFKPEHVLIDTTLLQENYIVRCLGGFPDEHEVIIKPGTYNINVSQIGYRSDI